MLDHSKIFVKCWHLSIVFFIQFEIFLFWVKCGFFYIRLWTSGSYLNFLFQLLLLLLFFWYCSSGRMWVLHCIARYGQKSRTPTRPPLPSKGELLVAAGWWWQSWLYHTPLLTLSQPNEGGDFHPCSVRVEVRAPVWSPHTLWGRGCYWLSWLPTLLSLTPRQ